MGKSRKKKKPPRVYTKREREVLWNRLFKILPTSESLIQAVMAAMEARRINPGCDHLRRKLASTGIYPPLHTTVGECCCVNCHARRQFPRNYSPRGISFECFLEHRAVAEKGLDPDIMEEIEQLRGEPPGVVVDARNRRARFARKRQSEKS